jgi:electron transport complex protein RnfG
MKYIIKPAATLLITAIITVGALGIVYNLTVEPIEKQKRRTQEKAMAEVMPNVSEYREIQIEKTGSIVSVHEALHFIQRIGYIVQLSPEGYSGKIDVIVGISIPFGKITGMRVLRHSETPGLGAQAVKENFYRQFDGRDLVPLSIVKANPGEHEIQVITSSTITTRAITDAVNEAVEWYFSVHPVVTDTETADYEGGEE